MWRPRCHSSENRGSTGCSSPYRWGEVGLVCSVDEAAGEKATTRFSSWLKKPEEEVKHKKMGMFQIAATFTLQILLRQRNPAAK